MKTLSGINKNFTDFAGKPVQGIDGPMTIQSLLIQCIGSFFASDKPAENILAHKVGQKIYDADVDLKLEDAEFNLLYKSVKEVISQKRFTSLVIAPLYTFMEAVKEQTEN